ncbi:MAG: nitroreductase [Proteobacteria bacterium]|nr:nitroreductase [Pseudomonadota bacterium]MDA1310768.1 nitroreductase [Pseudomonadota bacterium]
MSEAPIIETGYDDLNPVEEAISQRRSLRGFLPTPVPRETIERILYLAGRAPSGTNTQPWTGHVLTGAALKRLTDGLMVAANDPNEVKEAEQPYYPPRFFDPYLARRRKVGWDLYGLLGIKKGDFEKTKAQHDRNMTFFDAPVGLIFTIHRDLKIGSWLDFGMFLENVMILARSHGLETCPQAAFSSFHKTIRQQVDIGDEFVVVCGMAIGHADWSRPECALITDREPVSSFISFHDH